VCNNLQPALPLRELTCHMGSTVLPATRQRRHSRFYSSQIKLVLDLATPEGCKAELTQLAGYTRRWYGLGPTVSARSCLKSTLRRCAACDPNCNQCNTAGAGLCDAGQCHGRYALTTDKTCQGASVTTDDSCGQCPIKLGATDAAAVGPFMK